MISSLLTLIGSVCPAYDGPPSSAPTGPQAIVYGGTPTPAGLALTHSHVRTSHDLQIVCVSNNPAGARTVADAVMRAVDGHRYDATSRFEVTYASQPIEDRDDPSVWRWTVTVELNLTTGR